MRQLLALLVVLGIVAGPTRAQEKVVRLDYGFSYVIPRDYRPDPTPDTTPLGDIPISLVIKEGTTTRTLSETQNSYSTLSIISNINLIILRSERTITQTRPDGTIDPLQFTEHEARNLIEALNLAMKSSGTTLNFEKSTTIKVSGHDATVIRCNGFDKEFDALFTARLILMFRGTKLYLFTFAALNEEFEEKVGAFNAFMNSFKFLTPPGAKPSPKTPTKKPSRKK